MLHCCIHYIQKSTSDDDNICFCQRPNPPEIALISDSNAPEAPQQPKSCDHQSFASQWESVLSTDQNRQEVKCEVCLINTSTRIHFQGECRLSIIDLCVGDVCSMWLDLVLTNGHRLRLYGISLYDFWLGSFPMYSLIRCRLTMASWTRLAASVIAFHVFSRRISCQMLVAIEFGATSNSERAPELGWMSLKIARKLTSLEINFWQVKQNIGARKSTSIRLLRFSCYLWTSLWPQFEALDNVWTDAV